MRERSRSSSDAMPVCAAGVDGSSALRTGRGTRALRDLAENRACAEMITNHPRFDEIQKISSSFLGGLLGVFGIFNEG